MRGLIFRKSLNLGLIRVNFSKSGVSWSVAVLPGFIRYTRAVNGGRYWTFTLPGTGLSKRTVAKRAERLSRRPRERDSTTHQLEL